MASLSVREGTEITILAIGKRPNVESVLILCVPSRLRVA
jgi:hypothetical protein